MGLHSLPCCERGAKTKEALMKYKRFLVLNRKLNEGIGNFLDRRGSSEAYCAVLDTDHEDEIPKWSLILILEQL